MLHAQQIQDIAAAELGLLSRCTLPIQLPFKMAWLSQNFVILHNIKSSARNVPRSHSGEIQASPHTHNMMPLPVPAPCSTSLIQDAVRFPHASGDPGQSHTRNFMPLPVPAPCSASLIQDAARFPDASSAAYRIETVVLSMEKSVQSLH